MEVRGINNEMSRGQTSGPSDPVRIALRMFCVRPSMLMAMPMPALVVGVRCARLHVTYFQITDTVWRLAPPIRPRGPDTVGTSALHLHATAIPIATCPLLAVLLHYYRSIYFAARHHNVKKPILM